MTDGAEPMDTDVAAVLAELEELALASLRREIVRLRGALVASDPSEPVGLSVERVACTGALELFMRAHDAYTRVLHEVALEQEWEEP